jgi:excinuclease ABC subunit C
MIKINLKEIPEKPGVYIFKDKEGRAIYVGKAKNLRKRIASYFKNPSLKVKELLDLAEDLEILTFKSEVEAILKESDLIKKLNPYFNHLLRDDTNYFYVVFTKEKFPRVYVTHRPDRFKTYKVFGPFTEGKAIKNLLQKIRKKLPFCTCKESHLRECLNSSLGLCFGFCCLKGKEVSQKEINSYFENLKLIEKLLSGNLKDLKKEILEEMEKSLKEDNLILAKKLFDIYSSIKKIEEEIEIIGQDSLYLENTRRKILLELKEKLNLKEIPKIIEAYDISHLYGDFKVGMMLTFYEGFLKIQKIRKFRIKTVVKPDDPRMIYEVLKRRLKHKEWGLPNLILIDGGKIQLKFALMSIKEAGLEEKIKVISFAKPKEEIYFDPQKKPLSLKDFSSETADFLRLLDLKVHQFVLKYHKQLRENEKFN